MRPSPRCSRTLALVAGVALLVPVLPASAQSLDEARRERTAVQDRLDSAVQDLAALEARVGRLADETAALDETMSELTAVAREADQRVADRVREMYKRGVDTPLLQLLTGEDARAALERAELAGQLLAGDRVEIETALAARDRAAEVADRLAQREAQLAAAQDRQQQALADLRDDLARARALEERLVEEERQRQAEARRRAQDAARGAAAATTTTPSSPSAPTSGGLACPMGRPHSFTDTWGAPRSGGRSHEGVDILADYGTPVYAIVSGVWDVYPYGGSAGNWAILRGDDGHQYWYLHLQSHTVGDGATVSAGTQVGTNGDSGNAAGTPHVHFEYHPGGGGPVNPYPLARSACG